MESITAEFQEIEDELLAVDAQLKELSRNVTEPPQEGPYKTIICGNCHLRGHRGEGNKNKAACKNPPCILYVSCGQRKKHPEHFEEIKKLSKRRKQLTEKLDILDKNKKHLAAFESKTISAFTTAVTKQLAKAFPDRYDTRTAAGKIKLQKDIATIRIACNNKVPAVSTNDRSLFLELLEKQQQDFDEVNSLDRRKPIVSNVYSTLGQSIGQGQSMGHGSGNVNTVNNISSPVAVKKSKKKRRRSRSSSGSSSSLSSSSSSNSDEYVRRTIRHSRTSKRKSKKRRKRDKSESRRNVRSLSTRFERQNDFSELNTNFMPVTMSTKSAVSGKQQICRPNISVSLVCYTWKIRNLCSCTA